MLLANQVGKIRVYTIHVLYVYAKIRVLFMLFQEMHVRRLEDT